MITIATSIENDTVDLVIYRELGFVDDNMLSETLKLNPEVSDYGAVLPAGVEIHLPQPPTPTDVIETVHLWG